MSYFEMISGVYAVERHQAYAIALKQSGALANLCFDVTDSLNIFNISV